MVVAVTGDPRGRPCFILTRRALHLKRHAGQFALPGGKLDPGETFQQAALREMHEEVGVEATPGDVLGLLDDYPTRSDWVMRPVVVWAGCEPTLVPDPSEVADAYQVPFSELDQPGVPVLTPAPKGDHPVLSLPLAGTMVFAPTAAILYQALQVAFLGRETRVAHFEQPRFAWR